MKKEKMIVMKVLTECEDDMLFDKNFKRRSNSIIYQRKVLETIQKIDFDYQIRPYYNRTAIIRFYPILNIFIDRLQNEIDKVFQGYDDVPYLCRDIHANYTICQRVEFPGNFDRWFIYDENDYIDIGNQIKDYLLKYTIPFLDKCDSIEGLINTYENTDYIAIDSRVLINIIVAYYLCNQKQKAITLLEKKFKNFYSDDIYKTIFNAYCV